MSLRLPVVLVHGWGGSFTAIYGDPEWRNTFAAAGLDIVAIDLPGHGSASASHNPLDYADLAGQMCRSIPDEVVDAVGFSLGSKLLLELECRKPGRFRRLVLGGVGANVFAPEPGLEQVADVLESGAIDNAPEQVKLMLRYAARSRSNPRALAAVCRRPPNPCFSQERLARIQASVLIVNGSEDTGIFPADKLAEAVPDSKVITLEETGHIDLTDNPHFVSAAAAFISEG